MILITHFELKLHQKCLNHPYGCKEKNMEHIVCKLIDLSNVSRQWYLNIDEIITSLRFKENDMSFCIYFETCRKFYNSSLV